MSIFGYTGHIFLVVMTALNLYWVARGIKGFQTEDPTKWALQMFIFSLKVLLTLSVMLAVGARLL
jgi:protoheme IX farnesyltransferase